MTSPSDISLHRELIARVRHGMAIKGWSQKRLARESGLYQDNISRMLSGQRICSVVSWDRLLSVLEEPFPL